MSVPCIYVTFITEVYMTATLVYLMVMSYEVWR